MANNTKEGNRHIRRTAGATSAVLATAELMSALTGSAAVANVENRPSAIVVEGKMPSLNSPVTLFQGEVGVKPAAVEAQYVQPIRVESAEQAASLFGGDGDAYSQNPEHWFVNEYGGATLKPDASGKVHRVKANGAVVEGWIKIKKNGEHQAQTFVARPRDTKKLDINGGTFWRAPQGQEKALWRQVREQVKAKEAVTQPDVNVVPVCKPGDKEITRWVNPERISSPQEAARLFGIKTKDGDDYSTKGKNWKVNKDGSATLKEDPSGREHSVTPGQRGVLTGWNKIDRVSGYDAQAFVAVQLPGGLHAKGVTAYKAGKGDREALFYQLLRQTTKREAKEQPGVLVLPLCN
ncbi:MAG: hypothetical protein AAB532_02730 [Patescibacteria group bacterium]